MTEERGCFARHYRGRHAPEDALWWLDRPESDGPSGAPPPQRVFLEAADQLRSRGLDEAADALLAALADLLRADRRRTLDALADCIEERSSS